MAKSGSTTSARKRVASRIAILDATGELIAEKGLDGFTISEVARRGSVNRALVYHYFDNRDELVVQAVDRIIARSESGQEDISADSVERRLRMHIEHPEVARVFFQFLLSGRPLLRMGERITDTIRTLETAQQKLAPDSTYDAALPLIILVLAQMSWPFSRAAMASLLDVDVEEADERFIAAIRWATEQSIKAMTGSADQAASAQSSSP